MKTIFFISSNPGKIKEVKLHLKNFGINAIGKRLELPEINSEIQENVAREKAKSAAKILNKPVIVEDTGVYFEAYKNFPGTHPKFVFHSIGYDGIFRLLKGKSRRTYFKTVVSYCKPNKRPLVFTGICHGRITESVIGKVDWKLPFDAIFIPDGDQRTFSQMTKAEKARYSHRAKALEKFAKWFTKQ